MVDLPWNLSRRGLNHTDFGNGILRIWVDEGRWEGLLADAAGDSSTWTASSRQVWEETFAAWSRVRIELLEHAAQFERCGTGATTWSERVAWAVRRRRGRFAEWLAAIRSTIAEVDAAIESLGAARAQRPPDALLVRDALDELGLNGRKLKEEFSGRGYFNPTPNE